MALPSDSNIAPRWTASLPSSSMNAAYEAVQPIHQRKRSAHSLAIKRCHVDFAARVGA
jgi:hypothetical protein